MAGLLVLFLLFQEPVEVTPEGLAVQAPATMSQGTSSLALVAEAAGTSLAGLPVLAGLAAIPVVVAVAELRPIMASPPVLAVRGAMVL